VAISPRAVDSSSSVSSSPSFSNVSNSENSTISNVTSTTIETPKKESKGKARLAKIGRRVTSVFRLSKQGNQEPSTKTSLPIDFDQDDRPREDLDAGPLEVMDMLAMGVAYEDQDDTDMEAQVS